ncbi:hypothetical protein BVRB_011440 [Beta vulgaris subsp. vulgaris]|uniref:Uncharacterized protein n=1 Tax=Beta vulgaris subsp. vulgaris TaxID=3555 RepID=A0A0J8B5L3_BETVV|nr:hypothetical protein BVRB_011440 [Beta vulgaris subsp. vulgaris]
MVSVEKSEFKFADIMRLLSSPEIAEIGPAAFNPPEYENPSAP